MWTFSLASTNGTIIYLNTVALHKVIPQYSGHSVLDNIIANKSDIHKNVHAKKQMSFFSFISSISLKLCLYPFPEVLFIWDPHSRKQLLKQEYMQSQRVNYSIQADYIINIFIKQKHISQRSNKICRDIALPKTYAQQLKLPKRLHSFSVYNICSHVYILRKRAKEERKRC